MSVIVQGELIPSASHLGRCGEQGESSRAHQTGGGAKPKAKSRTASTVVQQEVVAQVPLDPIQARVAAQIGTYLPFLIIAAQGLRH